MIRDITAEDHGWVHALNKAHEVELSPLSPEDLAPHLAGALYARQAEGGAFLIAFDQDGAYDSPNFLWFKEKFGRFLYVDRVAVAASHRRRGLAATLYEDLFSFAMARDLERVVCEVNSDPPNPGSDAFHAALGFEIVGERYLSDRDKTVRYMAKSLG